MVVCSPQLISKIHFHFFKDWLAVILPEHGLAHLHFISRPIKLKPLYCFVLYRNSLIENSFLTFLYFYTLLPLHFLTQLCWLACRMQTFIPHFLPCTDCLICLVLYYRLLLESMTFFITKLQHHLLQEAFYIFCVYQRLPFLDYHTLYVSCIYVCLGVVCSIRI